MACQWAASFSVWSSSDCPILFFFFVKLCSPQSAIAQPPQCPKPVLLLPNPILTLAQSSAPVTETRSSSWGQALSVKPAAGVAFLS